MYTGWLAHARTFFKKPPELFAAHAGQDNASPSVRKTLSGPDETRAARRAREGMSREGFFCVVWIVTILPTRLAEVLNEGVRSSLVPNATVLAASRPDGVIRRITDRRGAKRAGETDL